MKALVSDEMQPPMSEILNAEMAEQKVADEVKCCFTPFRREGSRGKEDYADPRENGHTPRVNSPNDHPYAVLHGALKIAFSSRA